jgi:hypothetical protein
MDFQKTEKYEYMEPHKMVFLKHNFRGRYIKLNLGNALLNPEPETLKMISELVISDKIKSK